MMTAAARRVALALLPMLAAAPSFAQSGRESVYFTTPDNKISRALLGSGTAQTAVTDSGTNLKGLAARYDGNDRVTLLAANSTQGGGLRAYSCPSPTGACTALGPVTTLKYAVAVTLDTSGNAYAVNATKGGADVLLYLPRNPGCSASPAPAGCLPGGYGAARVIDGQVDGVSLLADVKVVPGTGSFGSGAKYAPGDVLVLAENPARILSYSGAAIKSFLAGTGPQPTPITVANLSDCQEPEGFAVFTTGELLVATEHGRIQVYRPDGTRQATDFAVFDGQGVNVAVGVEGGGNDPVADGRVLVTVRCANRVVSFGVSRVGGDLLAAPGVPTATVHASAVHGVADASLAGSIYTAASAGPVTVDLPNHEVTFEKVNSPGFLSGNYTILSEASVRATADTTCPNGKVNLEGVTRCVPSHVRGYELNGSTCQPDGTGCYYLVFTADTGANLFGGTQEHHFEEDDFGFVTSCYVSAAPGAGPSARQPRVFHATDGNDPRIVEDDDFSDISTGCNSHIGRGGQFSLFLTGWDSRSLKSLVSDKLAKLDLALNGHDAFAGGLAPYIDPAILGCWWKRNTLAYWLAVAKIAWACNSRSITLTALGKFLALVRSSPGSFEEEPAGLLARNAPGELIARAESASFLACGAAESCQRRLGP